LGPDELSVNKHQVADQHGRSARAPIRIASWPSSGLNAYIRLFYRALEPYGIEHVPGLRIDDGALRSMAGSVDAIHIQWCPEDVWRCRRGVSGRVHGVLGLWRYLRLASRLGIRVLWTVHDLDHHDGSDAVDRFGYRVLARGADLCVCHSEWSRRELIRRYGGRPARSIVMQHGNYDGVFPRPRDPVYTLRRLGLRPGRPTLACLGFLRPYKGFDLAIAAAARLADRCQLIVGGPPHDQDYTAALAAQARDLENVHLLLQPLPDDLFSDILHAADCVLLPYRRITGSAALLTALTFGRGVVASDLPYFREILAIEPAAGVLFGVGCVDRLAAAVDEFFNLSLDRRSAARRLADRCDWDAAIVPVAEWLQRSCSRIHSGAFVPA
jgi:glycosyltransferase involved in cell wall biosynthesis